MIDFGKARVQLATIAEECLGEEATVYSSGIDSLVSYPAVVIGMPRTEFNTQPCMDTVTWPISVVVARRGADSPVIDQLEMLWPELSAYLINWISDDQTLSGICKAATVIRADPGFLTVQGSDLPSQTITLELYG